MSCPDDDTILAFFEGELPPESAAAIEHHLDACPGCRVLFSRIARAAADDPSLPAERVPLAEQSTLGSPAEANAEALQPGREVGHFQIVRLLGRGGMGEVYLARDTRLGRKVALKMIRPGVLGSPAARDRFLFEARTTARFNHPHIVTIHDVGEDAGRPYLALEYLRGESLRQRLTREHLAVEEVVRIGAAIAEALSEAHRHGVLHRDLKPENVFLGSDGRLRVLDFGLAKALGPELRAPATVGPSAILDTIPPRGSLRATEGACGSPAYMAPEQWAGQECAATDLWALGVVLFELTTGRLPYRTASAIELAAQVCSGAPAPRVEPASGAPQGLVALIADCLAKRADLRPDAAAARLRLRELLAHAPTASEEPPFRGLLPFDEQHRHLFFGREAEIARFVDRLRETPTMPVLGTSGAGKSSFVRAGVIPRLRERGPLTVLQLRPGANPFLALGAKLVAARDRPSGSGERSPFDPLGESHATPSQPVARAAAGGPDAGTLAEELFRSPPLLSLTLHRLAEAHHAGVLLFVDQLEELYTLVADREQRQRFAEALCCAADDPSAPVRVIFTLRQEFLSHLAECPESRAVLDQVTVLRGPAPSMLAEALTLPLEAIGYRYDDPSLVLEMVDAVKDEPASLPLLQFAGEQLWEHRDREARLLRRSAYSAMGGIAGALARHADGVVDALPAPSLELARALFLRLVTADRTRRVLPRGKLLEGLGADAEGVLSRLVAARLLAARQAPAEREVSVELAHESLIIAWTRLRRWIDESREEIAMLAELGQAAELWERRGEREEEVWQGDALRDATRVAERSSVTLPPGVVRFLEAGTRRALRGVRRRWWRVGGALSLLALVAIAATVAALVIAGQKRSALSQRAEAERQGARAAERWRDLLEARARLRASLETEDSTAARALFRRLADDPLLWRRRVAAVLHRVASSPRGDRLAVAGSDRLIYLLDVESGAIVRVLRGHTDQVLAVAFAPDGRHLASGGWDGEVRLWDSASGRAEVLGARHDGAVWETRFSPDGRTVATAGADGTVKIWDVSSRRPLHTLRGHRGQVQALDFRRDGRLLVSVGQDGTVRLWDPVRGAELRAVSLADPLHAVRIAPDGALLAAGSESGTVRILSLPDAVPAFTLEAHTAPIWGLAFSPDGRRLASSTGGKDRSLRIWELATRSLHRTLAGHGAMSWVAFTDARRVASASMDRSVSLWDVDRGQPRVADEGHGGMVVGVSFSPDGKLVASGGLDQTVRIWRTASGDPAGALEGHTAKVFAVAFSPDGRSLASGGLDKTVRLWDLRTADTRHQLSHPDKVFDLAFSPDGATLAVAVQDRRLYLWSAHTGQPLRVLEGHGAPVHGIAFSPDGKRLASAAADRRVILWDASSGERLRVLEGHTGEVWGLAFSPDGRSLVSAGGDRAAWLWSTEGERPGRRLVELPGRLYWPAFHPDGTRVGLPGSDGLSRICELRGACRELRGHRAEVNTFRFSPDGKLAASSSDDGTLRLWDVARARPAWHAPALLATASGVELCAATPRSGWWRLEGGGRSPLSEAREPWRAVCGASRVATLSPTGTLCSAGFDDEVQLWELASGERTLARRVEGLQQLVAERGACVTLAAGRVQRLRPGRSELLVGEGASALASDGAGLLVAVGSEVRRLGPRGEVLARATVDPGATALARSGDTIILGYADGNLELVSAVARPRRAVAGFEEVPASRVERILPGPRDTAIVGYANGLVGLWSLETGKRLDGARLHGPITQLLLHERKLYAASELGRTLVWDLGDLYLDYCALLRKVWREVPVVWEGGRPAPQPPPAGHHCLER